MTTSPVVPKTGVTSTSFQVHAVAFLTAVVGAVYSAITNLTPVQHWTVGGGAALLALVSTAAKLIHDKGIHVATIAAVGPGVVAALPDIESLDPTITAKVEAEAAKIRSDVTIELAKVPDAAAIEGIVKQALSGLLSQAAAAPPAA